MIELTLNNTTIMGYGLKVSCEQDLPEADLSGQGSSSAAAERGVKPKRLKVSLKIKYEDTDVLSKILQLSIATDGSKGARSIYNINNQTASAFGVRQVRFTERVSAQELDGTHAWSVTFVLVEYLSTAEKIEDQLNADSDTTALASADSSVAEESSSTTIVSSWLDKLMAKLDTALSDEK